MALRSLIDIYSGEGSAGDVFKTDKMGNKLHFKGDSTYCAPDIRVLDVSVESGFALSTGGENGIWDGLQ